MRQIHNLTIVFLNSDERQQRSFPMVSPDLCAVALVLSQPSRPVCFIPPGVPPPHREHLLSHPSPQTRPCLVQERQVGVRPSCSLEAEEKPRPRTEFSFKVRFLSLCVSGISLSWPSKKPTSRSATSSATSLRSCWPRTRPRRPSPW